MKSIVLIIVLAATANFTFAENDPYTKAMTAALSLLENADSPEDYQAAANQFERIANVEKDQWLPNYYVAYAMLVIASNENNPSKKDESLDTAQKFLDKASANKHDLSEVLALQGFIHMIRIGADPATRGQEYSGKSAAALQKAIAINPDNPRAMFLLAQLSFGTAQFFGSDTSEACNQNEAALEIFKSQEDIKANDQLAPTWGKSMSEGFKARCNS